MKLRTKRFLLLVVFFCVILCAFLVVKGFNKASNDENNGQSTINQDLISSVDKATGKINVLILGVDVDGLRTDTIMVASYDLDKNKINILSIPRDTRMYVGNRYQKINSAHAITQNGKVKGAQGSAEAVTRLTGIPINYYVEFNFCTFKEFIDALGGVDFDVPQNMFYEDPFQDLCINLKKGFQHLDGDKSEQLVRFRRYQEGDIARVKVQQEFIKAVADQKLNAGIIKKAPEIFKTINKNIKTNLTLVDVIKYLPNLNDLSADSISMYQLPGGYNDEDYGLSYWIANVDKTKQIIEDVFGYDASKITIHSSDGKSVSLDKKIMASATPQKSIAPIKTTSPTKKPQIELSPKPTDIQEIKEKDDDINIPNPTVKPVQITPTPITPKEKPTQKPSDSAIIDYASDYEIDGF